MELRNNSLKIISINVNSIVTIQRRNELLNFLHINDPDFLLLNETKLKPHHTIALKNYFIIRTDRIIIKGGGTAILVKRDIEFETITNSSSIKNKLLEFTIIKIKLKNHNNLFIICAYATNDNRDLFITELNTICEKLKLFYQKIITSLSGISMQGTKVGVMRITTNVECIF